MSDDIREKSRAAVAQRDAYVNSQTDELQQLYDDAAEEIGDALGDDETRPVSTAESAALIAAAAAVLKHLAKRRNALLEAGLETIVQMAGMPFQTALPTAVRRGAAAQSLRQAHEFVHADGLKLSARLWRNDRHAREVVAQHIRAALINGDDAFHAMLKSTGSGKGVPPHIARAYDASRAGALKKSLRDVMTGRGSPLYQAERLFRTELIRAHGEAYMANAAQLENFAGFRFMLSPHHPKPDICDTHATADLYGLGPGVYPDRDSCPWPAHPNTFSSVVAVLKDEIGTANPSVKKAPPPGRIDTADFKNDYQDLNHQIAKLRKRGITSTDALRAQLDHGRKWTAARLGREQQEWLKTTAEEVWLSDSTLIKQINHHGRQPVQMKHYQNLQEMLDNAQVIIPSEKNSVIFFKEDNRMMKAVLKTTQDGSEVYLTSLHISDKASVRRALKKYTAFRNEYGAL